MQWTKCLVTNDILNRIRYNRARKFRVSVPKGGHLYVIEIRDTVGLLIGFENQLKGAINTHLLTISEVEISSCRCWFSTSCAPQGVSRHIVCCEILYDLLNVVHSDLAQFSLWIHFKPMSHLYIPWRLQKTCNFLMFLGRAEIDYWHEIG